MTSRSPWPPRSRREILALICIALLVWLAVMMVVAGVSGWSGPTLGGLGIGGAAFILSAGGVVALRFRR